MASFPNLVDIVFPVAHEKTCPYSFVAVGRTVNAADDFPGIEFKSDELRYFLHGFRLKDDFKNSPMIIYSRFHVSPRRGRETTPGDPATRLEVWLNGFRFQGEAGR